MKIIFGLGNPGLKYSLTRHNLGFMVLDKLAARWNVSGAWYSDKKCQIAEYRGREKILLAKPQTYMNLSGEAAVALLHWYKITPDDIIVIYDDAALQAGKLRLRAKGSSGGHRGIESLIDCLGTDIFPRLKIGVGQPEGQDMAAYVLAGFSREEMVLFEDALEKAADAVECVLEAGITETMNKFN